MLGYDPNHAFILLAAASFCWYALIVWVFFVDHTSGVPKYKDPPSPPKKRVTTDETSFEKRGGIC